MHHPSTLRPFLPRELPPVLRVVKRERWRNFVPIVAGKAKSNLAAGATVPKNDGKGGIGGANEPPAFGRDERSRLGLQ